MGFGSKNKLFVFTSIVTLFVIFFSINSVYGFTPTYGSMSSGFSTTTSSPLLAGNVGSTTGAYLAIKSLTAQDGFDGFRRRSDSVAVVVQASFGPNKTVTPQNLEIYMSGYGLGMFDACKLISAQSSLYECVFQESNSSAPVTSVTQNYEVRLVSNYGIEASASKFVMVDSAAPSINSFTLSSTRTAGTNITSSFSVRDYASGKSGTGVGLVSVIMTVDGSPQYTYPIASTSDSVVRFSSLTKTAIPIVLGSEEKTYSICITAVDAFNYQTQMCQQVQVDKTAPDIQISSFELVDETGNPPRWFGHLEYPLTATLIFQGADLDVASIRGNFSSLRLDKEYGSLKPSCTKTMQDSWKCTFSFIAQINQTKSFSLIFTALDTLKNKAESKIQYSLNYDGSPPLATKLYTQYFYDGDYYIGKPLTDMMIPFDEPGIGMNSSLAYLDLSAIGVGLVKADECIPQWDCYWSNISASSANVASLADLKKNVSRQTGSQIVSFKAKPINVTISTQTQDDLGNFALPKKLGLVVDIFPPEIITSNISSIPSSTEFSNFTTMGDSISVKLTVRDALPVYITVDAAEFFNSTEPLEFDCTDNGDGTHVCAVIIGPIARQGYYKSPLSVTVIDMLNNTLKISKEIEVTLIDDKPPTYWTGEVLSCAPNPLDRKLVDKLSSNIYCSISLKAAADISIYDITEGPCYPLNTTGGKNIIASSLSSSKWLGLTQKKPSIYLNLVTGTFDPRVDSLNYECYVQIRSKVSNTAITRLYEPVTMQFHISLYDNPMGEVNDSVYKEIEGVYNTYIGGAWDIVGYLNSFITLSEKLCKVVGTIDTVLRAMDSVQTLLSFKTQVLQTSTWGKPASIILGAQTSVQADGKAVFQQSFKKMTKDFINPYCDFISCRLWFGDDNAVGQWQEMIVSSTNFLSSGFGATQWLKGDTAALGSYNYSKLTSVRYYDPAKQAKLNQQLNKLRQDAEDKKKKSVTNDAYGRPASGGTQYIRDQLEYPADDLPLATGKVVSDLPLTGKTVAITGMTENPDPFDPARRQNNPPQVNLPATVGGGGAGGQQGGAGGNGGAPAGTPGSLLQGPPAPAAPAAPAAPSPASQVHPDGTPNKDESSFGSLASNANIKESWILSTLTLCVPGMIYNLEKWRQIQCDYGMCLSTAAQSSLPVSLCKDNKAYNECVFFWGPIFELIPFASFMTMLQNMVVNIIANPIILVDAALDLACNSERVALKIHCTAGQSCFGWSILVKTCLFYDTLDLFMKVYSDLKGYMDPNFMKVEMGATTGSCKSLAAEYEYLKTGKRAATT